jgi:ABC-type transport system involved in multi-copper enzyme maturation permease subunit
MSSLSAFDARSPVMQAELTYQQRSSAVRRPRRLLRRFLAWPWKLLLALAIMSAVILLVVEPFSAAIGYDFASLPAEMHLLASIVLFFIPVVSLIPLTLLIHFRTQLRTLAFASNTISREKRGGTWDILLLTPVSARQIVRGKWWATVRHVWREYLLLALLRAGSILWVTLEAGRYVMYSYPTYRIEIRPHYYEPHPLYMLLGLGLIVGFTLLNVLYTAAFGTLGSVFNRGGGTSLTLAIAIRTVTLIGLALGIGLLSHLIFLHGISAEGGSFPSNNSPFFRLYMILYMAAFTLFDNGSILSGIFTNHSIPPSAAGYYEHYISNLVIGGLVAIVMYFFLTWLSLRLAQWFIRRQGALVPHREWWLKLKKKQVQGAASAG